MKKRALSWLLAVCMVVSLAPQTIPWAKAADEDSDNSSTDAFGIKMHDWTAEQKKAAEGEAPFGSGYGTWTTISEKNELFVSMGYDRKTQRTKYYDWNGTASVGQDVVKNAVGNFSQDGMSSQGANYTAVETAPMDLNNSGKKEYVATLSFTRGSKNSGTLQLYVTDTKNNVVTDRITVANNKIEQLNDLDTYELKGAFSIAAGDFDGDGKDTIIVYIPRMSDSTNGPFIAEYEVNGKDISAKSNICSNVVSLLGNSTIKENLKDQPMVSLVADDADKDGFDELVVTAGMNDVTTDDTHLGSRLFVYDKLTNGTWNQSYENELKVSEDDDRIVWASSTVGNMVASTGTGVDYPEILSAGFVDHDKGKHINLHGEDYIGVVGVKVKSVSSTENKFTITGKDGKNSIANNVICNYQEMFKQRMNSNGWTKGGLYEKDDVNSLLQVQAFADRGIGEAESVFISGSVYRVTESGVTEKYKYSEFDSKDKGATSGAISQAITNTNVISVAAGNFNGNEFGQEQIIFVTALRQSGKNNTWSRVYCYYNEYDNSAETKTDAFKGERSSYLTEHKGAFYITLNAVDPDNDSTVAYLNDVSRTYSQPDVLAILEASPYFKEIGEGDIGNSQTVYGTSTSSGSEKANSFGFTVGIMVGYEHQNDVTQSGGGFETNIDNSFNWTTAKSESTEWGIEYSNDTGDNVVVVYRCPVVSYQYIDQNGKELVVSKTGEPASSMIPVEEYNEAAEQYGLERITDENVGLADAGNPMSYRSSTTTLPNAIEADGTTAETTKNGWVQYKSSGTTTQSITKSKETAKTFDYTLDISFTAYGMIGGFKAGVNTGFTYNRSETSINGESVTKSGSVNGQNVNGYDFAWRFAAWQTKINANTIPVLGYLVQDVVAPPSPAQNLRAETITKDSITLSWDLGDRGAQQYRIYRVLGTSENPVLVGAVDGDKTSYTLKGLTAGDTYTYVVRGVAYDAAGNPNESVDSSSLTVRTQSASANVQLTLSSTPEDALKNGTLNSSGASAVLNVSEQNLSNVLSKSYEWQIRQVSAQAQASGWVPVKDLIGHGIGSATGTQSTLKMQNIDKSLNGSLLRCVVTCTSQAGTPEKYYTELIKLSLDGETTSTTLTVTGQSSTGATGKISDPYVGQADYNKVTSATETTTVTAPVEVTDSNNITYTVHEYKEDGASSPNYVGVSNGTYIIVTLGGDGSYTPGAKLTEGENYKYYYTNGETKTECSDVAFDGVTTVTTGTRTVDGKTLPAYALMCVLEKGAQGAFSGLTEYWYSFDDGEYYNVEADRAVGSKAASQPTSDDDIRSVYYYGKSDGKLILEAAEDASREASDDYYEVYTKNSGSYELDKTIWKEADTKLYTTSQGTGGTPVETVYADKNELTVVEANQTVETTKNVTKLEAGTQLTLNATVTAGGTNVTPLVDYVITNTTTGSETTLTKTAGQPVTWTAPAAGLYRIVATARATVSTQASSVDCYYQADTPDTEYQLVVKQSGTQVTNVDYTGNAISLELQKRDNGQWTPVNDGISYTVAYNVTTTETKNGVTTTTNKREITDLGNTTTYKPERAVAYDFSAVKTEGNTKTTLASARLVVNKVAITVKPTWGREETTGNIVPEYGNIRLVVTNGPENLVGLNDAMKASCSLYDEQGDIKANAATGVYTVEPVYKTGDAAKLFQSRYNVTLETDKIYYFSGSVTVHFEAGENGEVSAWYQDTSGTEFAFPDGSQIRVNYPIKFTASPKDGYTVGTWKVTKQDNSPIDTAHYNTNGNTLTFTEAGMKALENQTIKVHVDFVNSTNQIQYSVGSAANTGTLTAKVGDNDLTSGNSVAHNATVKFTADPANGQMVDHWTIDGTEYKWEGTEDTYRELTLELKNVSASHEVQVFFTSEQKTEVRTLVDPNTAGTISVADANGTAIEATDGVYTVSQSTALVFTANLTSAGNNTVKEWQTSTDGKNWTTVEGSGGKTTLTVNEHSDQLYVKAIVASAQSFKLDWQIKLDDTIVSDDAIAKVTAKANGQTIKNGESLSAYIPVEFALTLGENYYLVKWDGAEGTGNTAKLSSLNADTTVTVTIAEKPVVTVGTTDTTKGSITVTGTRTGSSTADGKVTVTAENGHVDKGSTITIKAEPTENYYVTKIKAGDTVLETYTDGYGQKTATVTIDANTEVTVEFTEKPTVTIVGVANGTVKVDGKLCDRTTSLQSPAVTTENATFMHVNKGSTITITATPSEGNFVSKIKVNTTEYDYDTAQKYQSGAVKLEDVTVDNNTAIVVTTAAKPVVTFSGDDHITVTAKQGDKVLENGDYVEKYSGDIIFTATPVKGYETADWNVSGWSKVNDATSDDTTYTKKGQITENVNISVTATAIPPCKLNLSVQDLGGGTYGGTVSAEITRKSLNDYTDDKTIANVTDGSATFYRDSDIVITANPDEGYRVQDWTIDGETTTTTEKTKKLSDLKQGAEVKVRFVKLVTGITFGPVDKDRTDGYISAAVSNNESILNSATSGVNIAAGQPITFTATVQPGYEVEGWYVNDSKADGSETKITYTYPNETSTSSIYIEPRFQQVEYDITTGDNVTVNGQTSTTARGGTSLTFKATPPTGKQVIGWTVNGKTVPGSSDTLTWTVENGYTTEPNVTAYHVEAQFSAGEYSVTYAQPTGGTLTASVASGAKVNGGTRVTFTATPAEGYEIDQWTVNGRSVSADDTYTLNVTENSRVAVSFKQMMKVTASLNGQPGKITITAGGKTVTDGWVSSGTDVTFTVIPDQANDMVQVWTVNNAEVSKMSETADAPLTWEVKAVTADTSVTATLIERPTYTITVTSEGNGTATAEPTTVKRGGSTTITATRENNNYRLKKWVVDGTDRAASGDTLTLNEIRKNTTVKAVFDAAISYNVTLDVQGADAKTTVTATANGSAINPTKTSPVSIVGGSELVFTASPAMESNGNNKQMVAQWTVKVDDAENTELSTISNELKIPSLTGKTEVTVKFVKYEGFAIPTGGTGYTVTDIKRTPDDTKPMDEIRKNGTVSFTVTPAEGRYLTALSIGNVNCLATIKDTATDKLTVVNNQNGSYTITVANVTKNIELKATSMEFQIVKPKLDTLPTELVDKYENVDALKTELRTQVNKVNSSISSSNIQYYDIQLQYTTDGGNTWTKATKDHFPANGITVEIPYADLQSGLDSSYTYTVIHMFTTDMKGHSVGNTESITPVNGANGISFKVDSLSPFAIGWYKYTGGNGGGGGGGGGVVSTYTLTFDTNGGSAIDKITKDSGTTIDLAAYKPTRAGYTFAGWYSDKELTKAVTSVKLTANTTVYAKWTQDGGTTKNPFVDVKEGAYYYDAVLWAVDQKITSGTSATTFSPDASCTRAQMVTFLWRAAGSPKAENTKNPFTDVKADAYYYDAVLWAVEKGVTSGTSATTFSPDATVTRGQTVTFLYRNAGSPDVTGTMPFTDVEADAYYAKAVLWAVQQKITTGTSENTFSPANDCTRGQIVTFLYRAK